MLKLRLYLFRWSLFYTFEPMNENYSYIQMMMGNPFEGFDEEEAINNVGVTYDDFIYRIQDKKGKLLLLSKVDLKAVYYFTLFYYYRLFAHNIEVYYLPELFNYCDIWTNIINYDEIILSGRIEGMNKKSRIYLEKPYDNTIIKIITESLKSIPRFVRLNEIINNKQPEQKFGTEFLTKRQMGYAIAIKLARLYTMLFYKPLRLYHFTRLEPEYKKEIVQILKAFGFFRANPSTDDYRQLESIYKEQKLYNKGLFCDRKYAYGRLAGQFVELPKDLNQVILFGK